MGKDDPTIGLYGINGVYNYGCEAIIRGTEIILREIWPDVHIKYVSLRPEDDKKRLKGTKIEVIPRKRHKWYNTKLWYLANSIGLNIYMENVDWVNDCDAIFSIGGDLYTSSPDKDRKIVDYYNPLLHFGDLVKKKGKKFVIWGASVGPFGNAPKIKMAFLNHLNNVDLITSREIESTEYLKEIGIHKNVVACADPAFAVSKSQCTLKSRYKKDKTQIGINLSPLSSLYTFGESYNDEIVGNYVEMIIELIRRFDAEVTLIPHVVSKFDKNDDDLQYLKFILSKLPENLLKKVHIVDKDNGFISTKEILVNCDIVIASRMHCAINAIEAKVPVIFVAYSKKAVGMAKYVYGNEKWVIPLKDMTPYTLSEIVDLMLLEKESINSFLDERLKEIKLDVFSPAFELKELLSKH